MKKLLSLALTAMLALPLAAFGQGSLKIGTKNMEREINEFRQTRENQLREQALRMREGIVKEITEIVNDKVKTLNMDLVFDKSGMSFNGVPLVMYSRDSYDFTNDVVAALNKPGRTSTLNTEMPSSPPAAAAKTSPIASATPKKP